MVKKGFIVFGKGFFHGNYSISCWVVPSENKNSCWVVPSENKNRVFDMGKKDLLIVVWGYFY